ncbi:hypothetical protein D3C80_2150140 [compost metagenome]
MAHGARVPATQLARRPPAPTSLGSLGGAPDVADSGKMTEAKLDSMSDAEFDAMFRGMQNNAKSRPRV